MEELLASYFSGELSDKKRKKVEEWRSASSENAEMFLASKQVWIVAREGRLSRTTDVDELLPVAEIPRKTLLRKTQKWPTFVKYGAAACVSILIVVMFWPGSNNEGKLNTVTLDDGTEVVLHGNSHVVSFSQNDLVRQLKVKGKAYIDVEPAGQAPFQVVTEDALVNVTGTSFLLDTYKNRTEVCVEKGSLFLVKAEGVQKGLRVELTAGQMGMVRKGMAGIVKRVNENPNYLSWKTRKIIFETTYLKDAAAVLSDVYGVDVACGNEVADEMVTVTLEEEKLHAVMKQIANKAKVNFSLEDGKTGFY